MKLNLDPAVTAPRLITSVSLALAAWYDANPAIRRMWAIERSQTLRVIVELEPTADSSDVYPVWLASGLAWARELQSQVGSFHADCSVELELIDEPMKNEIETEVEGDLVVAMSWRDPALLFI